MFAHLECFNTIPEKNRDQNNEKEQKIPYKDVANICRARRSCIIPASSR